MEKPENQNALFYGIDLPIISQHPTGKGHIDAMSELRAPISQAIEFLKKQHGGPIHGIGMSLGALLLSQVAVYKPSSALNGLVLLSPAFKPHPSKTSFTQYRDAGLEGLKNTLKRRLGCKFKEGDVLSIANRKLPTPSSTQFSPLQRAILRQKTVDREQVNQLSLSSYLLKLFPSMAIFRQAGSHLLTLPVRLYGAETDDLIDPKAIQETFNRFRSQDKALKLYPKALHNLILDPLNTEIAQEISDFFAKLNP
jgi:alpha-beta hydrolase superfamily lysophospholipase